MATSVDQKLLKSTKFPTEFNQKVDMQKVNLEVMKKWIAGKIAKILGNEDDVVVELCFNLIEGSRFPDIKKLQIQLTGFLERDTPKFCQELWKLCLSAQNSPQGVPKELLEAKKLELIQEKIEAEKAAEEARQRQESDQRRDREMDAIRNRERGDRARGSGRAEGWRSSRGDRVDRGLERGGRDGGRDLDRRGHRWSGSLPRRRDSRDRRYRGPHPSRVIDTYVPSSRSSWRRDEPRRRSHSLSPSPSRYSISRSPSPRRRRLVIESQSPPRQRRRSFTRSPSPDRSRRHYRGRGGRGGGRRSPDRNVRRRSYTPSDISRSRSPRPRKRRRPSKSPSLSPPPRQRRRGRRDSFSRSRRSSIASSEKLSFDEMDILRTGIDRKGRERDERRLTRSNSRDRNITPPRRRRPFRSRSRSRSGRDQKRRRSIQRYVPERRRRNTSSVSSPINPRDEGADNFEVKNIRRPPSLDVNSKSPDRNRELKRASELEETVSPQKEASELREKLLREKIMKMRTSSANPNAQANRS